MNHRAKSLRRRGFLTAIVLSVAVVGLELSLRCLIFAGDSLGAFGERFQQPSFYADSDTEEYWALRARLRPAAANVHRYEDPVTGWRSYRVAAETYRHADEGELAGRRPILLFGDSFAACLDKKRTCFESLLESSEYSSTHGMLNYGCNGFGIGQAFLAFRESIDLYAQLDPLVILGVYMDDDLDRTGLSLREHPKPRFTLRDGALELQAPLMGGQTAWLEENGIAIRSYLWRFFLYGSDLLPRGVQLKWSGRERRLREKLQLNAEVLATFQRELEARGLEGFLLLFPGEYSLDREPGVTGQESLLSGYPKEIGLPYVNARGEIEAALSRGELEPEALFVQDGPGDGHYSAQGNAIVFRALARGIMGEFDG